MGGACGDEAEVGGACGDDTEVGGACGEEAGLVETTVCRNEEAVSGGGRWEGGGRRDCREARKAEWERGRRRSAGRLRRKRQGNCKHPHP